MELLSLTEDEAQYRPLSKPDGLNSKKTTDLWQVLNLFKGQANTEPSTPATNVLQERPHLC